MSRLNLHEIDEILQKYQQEQDETPVEESIKLSEQPLEQSSTDKSLANDPRGKISLGSA